MSTDVLYYFSGSADKAPGTGANESILRRDRYKIISSIPGWRQILSNFHISEFSYEGKRYRTVEHAFQSAKIEIADTQAAFSFSLDSCSTLSRGDGNNARHARKMIVLNKQQLQQWDKIKQKVMENILFIKFSQDTHAGRVLVGTLDAQLWHGAPRVSKVRQYSLETIRSKIRTDPNILAHMLIMGDFNANTDSVLENLIHRNNIIPILARVDMSILSPATLKWLSEKGFHPEWFVSITKGDITENTASLWTKFLANAIVARNNTLVSQLLPLYKQRLTLSIIQNMLSLARGDNTIIQIIKSQTQ